MVTKSSVLLLLIIGLILFIGCNIQTKGDANSISGKVIPEQAGIRVQAIQNLSLINETLTDEKGNFKIAGLKKGNYSLLFKSDHEVYVYNNRQRETDIKDTLSSSSSNILIDLNRSLPLMFKGLILVTFKPNISDEEVNETIDSCQCRLAAKDLIFGKKIYTLATPPDKTEFEIVRELRKNEKIESADIDFMTFAGDYGTKY